MFNSALCDINSEKQIDIQGHIGCRALLPENSLLAFEIAIDLDFDIEQILQNKCFKKHKDVID